MITRLLESIARLALARPRLVMAAAVVPALLSLHALSVPVDLSFAGLMDRQHPEVARYFEASERFGLGGVLPTLVEGPEAELDEAVAALARRLEALDVVTSVIGEPPHEWLRERSPWLVDRETFQAWLAFANAPRDPSARARLQARMGELEAVTGVRRSPGTRLVVVQMADDGFELALDADAFPRVRSEAAAVLAPHGARAHFSGMPAIITQEQEATLARMSVLAPISLLAVVVLLLFVERRPAVLLGVAAAMLLSLGATLALVGLINGRLTLMESVFGVMVFGLGVDFAIHLRLRLQEERIAGYDFATSLRRAVAGTGLGIVAGAVTTAGAFFIMALAPDPVFRTLGLSGGIGLLLCLLCLVIFLPAHWTLLERRRGMAAGSTRALRGRGIARLATRASRAPGTVLAISGLLVAIGLTGLSHLRYETDLERVFSRDIDAVHTARRIHALYGVDPRPWLVAVEDLAGARAVANRFRADPLFRRADSMASFLPEDTEQRRSLLGVMSPLVDARTESLRVALAASPGQPDESLVRALDALVILKTAIRHGPPSEQDLPLSLRKRLVAADGRYLVYAFVEEPRLDASVAARERRVAQAIHPEATSMNVVFEALIGTERPWIGPLAATVLLYIAAVLYLDLRRWRLVILALLPVSTGSIVTVGVLSWLGFSFNTVTLVGIPLLLGLGVDDGIHVVHRLLEEPERPLGEAIGAVGRSIAMTTATTCASVAALLFTRHPGIESVAILLLVGLPICLLASIALVPACARVCLQRPFVEAAQEELA